MNLFPLCHQILGIYECANTGQLFCWIQVSFLYVCTLEASASHLYILKIGLGLASRLVVCLCLKSDFQWAQSNENEYENSPIVWDSAHTSFYTGKLKHSTGETRRQHIYDWRETLDIALKWHIPLLYCINFTLQTVLCNIFHHTIARAFFSTQMLVNRFTFLPTVLRGQIWKEEERLKSSAYILLYIKWEDIFSRWKAL